MGRSVQLFIGIQGETTDQLYSTSPDNISMNPLSSSSHLSNLSHLNKPPHVHRSSSISTGKLQHSVIELSVNILGLCVCVCVRACVRVCVHMFTVKIKCGYTMI